MANVDLQPPQPNADRLRREIRIRLQSNNATEDAKIDYTVIDLNYRSK